MLYHIEEIAKEASSRHIKRNCGDEEILCMISFIDFSFYVSDEICFCYFNNNNTSNNNNIIIMLSISKLKRILQIKFAALLK